MADLAPRSRRNLLLAFLLGLVPGLGLFYAAPWVVAAGATVAVLVVWKLLGWIPLLGSVIMGVLALASGALNLLYARQYNQLGERPRFVLPER